MMDKDVRFAKEIYKDHIRAFSLGKFTEPGNEEKNSIERFIEEFQKTFKDIKKQMGLITENSYTSFKK